MDNEKRLNEAELDMISGGESDEERRRKEREQHGTIVKDGFGNVTFTDKTGCVGTFTADEWSKLRTQWAYTGNPEYFMETINVNELKGVLLGL